jgi:hypothetical protein
MAQYSFLTQRIPAQIGLTIFLIVSLLFLIFFFWNLQRTQSEILSLEIYQPLSIKKAPFLGIGDPLKEKIKISAKDNFLDFERESFWLDEDFSKIRNLGQDFKKREMDSFKSSLSKENLEVSNLEIEIDEKQAKTVLSCQIKGKGIEKNSYDFNWLLKNFPFDFSKFQKQERKLIFFGKLKETDVEIYIEFQFPIEVSETKVWQK